MSWFKDVTNYESLKARFRQLAKQYHPDAGGDAETMRSINMEYDRLFPIYRRKKEKAVGHAVNESAESTRMHFYTQNGWAGSNYNPKLTTKEICAIIRSYVKDTYPTYKFSVRCDFAAYCSEIRVVMKESPLPVYKTFDELTGREARFGGYEGDFNKTDIKSVWFKAIRNCWIDPGCYDEETDERLRTLYEDENKANLKVLTEIADSVIKDVDAFVNSYRYEDNDYMTDYHDTSNYYFGCKYRDVNIVPRTARVGKNTSRPVVLKEYSGNLLNTPA